MISRDWKCLNRSCGRIFHSFDRGNPPCTYCGCVKVSWIPGGGHVGKAAPQADAVLKSLAQDYGMSNINSGSHSRLNRAMPKYQQPAADMPVKHWGMGFASPSSSQGSICVEAGAQVGGKVTTNRALPASSTIASPALNTTVVGRHAGGA